jgi:hypothetical protein
MLEDLHGEPGIESVRATQPLAKLRGVGKPQLKMANIAHDFLPVLHTLVQGPTSEGKPHVLHGLGEEGHGCYVPGGQIEVLVAQPLDSPDGDGLQGM